MNKVVVTYNYEPVVVEKPDPEDSWDRGVTDNNFELLELLNKQPADGGYSHEVEVDFEPQLGVKYWVLAVKYSSGDSFGTTRGNGEVIGVFTDRQQAKDAEYRVNNGTWMEWAPWDDYFARIEAILIEEMIMYMGEKSLIFKED